MTRSKINQVALCTSAVFSVKCVKCSKEESIHDGYDRIEAAQGFILNGWVCDNFKMYCKNCSE